MNIQKTFFMILRKASTFLAEKGFFNILPDEVYLKMRYKLCIGKKLDLDNPRTFNEKLQWLKINNRKNDYVTMVDKVLAKEFVGNIIGEKYIIPTIGCWNRAEEIDFDKLPNQFVLKCNHDSGGIVICKDKSLFNKQKAIKKLNKALKRTPYFVTREWPYKNVQRKILAEPYIEDNITRDLRDYKFFAFNGEVKAMFIASERQNKNISTKFDFFDSDFNFLPIINGHPNSEIKPKKPCKFDEMKEMAEKLSIGLPHIRIDFYEANGNVYFGELTFFHYGGMVPFEPQEWDEVFGAWIDLSLLSGGENC